jgi:ribosome-associated protein
VDLQIDSHWVIPERDWVVRYVHSSGPGGQNVNKVATKVELRLFLAQTRALSESQKQRLRAAFPSHVTRDGDFLLSSDRFRSQVRNQADAFERLSEMILSVRRAPTPRKATRPTRASKERRLSAKRHNSERKQQRKSPDD